MVATAAKKKERASSDRKAPSDRSERLGEVLDFMRLLWAVDHALQSMSKRMEGSLGVTGPQRLVIRIVGRFPQISAGELASVLHIHPSTLTGILKRLESRGIIDRKPDPSDARRALFGLTAKGRDIDALRVGTVEAVVRRTLGRLPSRKVTAARDVLASISTALLEENE
jgi:DNA-binding MarR family transcriptional regulator